MTPRTWKLIAAYGLLTAMVLVCLYLASLAPLWLNWGRELLAAAIAVAALLVGLRFAPIGAPTAISASGNGQALPATDTVVAPITDSTLTVRELEVLRLLADGLRNKEMARTLSVSENTIKTHLANIYEKLQVGRRTEALAVARRQGLIDG